MWPLSKKKKFAELEDHDLLVMIADEVVGNNEVEEVMMEHNLKPAMGMLKLIGAYFVEMGRAGIKDFSMLTEEKNNEIISSVFNRIVIEDFFDPTVLNNKLIKAQSQKTMIQTSEVYKNMDRSDKKAFQKYGVMPQNQGMAGAGVGVGVGAGMGMAVQQQGGGIGGFFDTLNQGIAGVNQGIMGMNSMAYTMNNTAQMAKQTGQNFQQIGQQPMGQQMGVGMGQPPAGMQMGQMNYGQQQMYGNQRQQGGY